MSPTAAIAQRSASDALVQALISRRAPGGRVTFSARIADRIVLARKHIDGARLQHAIREMERLLERLPADAAGHVEQALDHAREALAALEGNA